MLKCRFDELPISFHRLSGYCYYWLPLEHEYWFTRSLLSLTFGFFAVIFSALCGSRTEFYRNWINRLNEGWNLFCTQNVRVANASWAECYAVSYFSRSKHMTFNAKPSINTILMSSHLCFVANMKFTSESVYQKCRLIVIIRIVSVVPILSSELVSL